MKRKTVLVLILICTGIMMSWAGGAQEKSESAEITEPVKLDFWYSLGAKYAAPLEKIIKDFNVANPMISVNAIYQGGYSTTRDKLLTAYIAGNPPVMSQIDQCFAGVFVENNSLVSLESFIKADKSFDLEDFNPYILKGGTYSGEIYGLPLNVSLPVLYINRDLFKSVGLNPDKYPETWEQAYEYSMKMSDQTASTYGFRIYSSDWIYHSLFKQFGSDLFSPDNKKAIFNNKEGKQALAFWQKMVNDKVAIYIRGKEGSAMDAAGKIGMVPRSTGSLHWYLDNATFDFGVAPFTLGKHKAVSLGGTNVYMFNKSTDIQQSAGWKLLTFMTNKENLTHFALNTGYMTSRKSSFESPEIQKIMTDDPRFRVTYDQLVHSFPAPKVGPFSEIDDIIHDALDRIIIEGESVDILDKAAAEVQTLLM